MTEPEAVTLRVHVPSELQADVRSRLAECERRRTALRRGAAVRVLVSVAIATLVTYLNPWAAIGALCCGFALGADLSTWFRLRDPFHAEREAQALLAAIDSVKDMSSALCAIHADGAPGAARTAYTDRTDLH